jgi:HEAT repeat protein
MNFYDLPKQKRGKLYIEIQDKIQEDIETKKCQTVKKYFDNNDTYIRKAAYLGIGRLYKNNKILRKVIVKFLEKMMNEESEKIRQTAVNSAGEIAMIEFETVENIFITGLEDNHHLVRNAIQGSLKKAGEKNPQSIILFCDKYINSNKPEIRRQVAHGLELRGRKNPEEIMPILRKLQFEKHRRVRPMIIHIFGQISYRKGNLEKVIDELLTWEDIELAKECFNEIIKLHGHINFRTIETKNIKECIAFIEQKIKSRKKLDNYYGVG